MRHTVEATIAGAITSASEILRFGRCELLPYHRELRVDGRTAQLGGRAFDLLLALVAAQGRLLTKDEILTRVWPGVIVEDNTLQVQVSMLRKVLGGDRDAVKTISGRGYRFVAELKATGEPSAERRRPRAIPVSRAASTNVPAATSELVGRVREMRELTELTAAHRLVTLTGPGGVGKSRLATEAARMLLPSFRDGVWYVDFAAVCEPAEAALAAARMLRVDANYGSADHHWAALADRNSLIVLDNCEHLIDASAALAETLLCAGANLRVIVATREALRCDGEHVMCVPPLAVPPETVVAGERLLEYGAVALFAARAGLANRVLSEPQTASRVAALCRGLDGLPLAIELAAARVSILGIEAVAACHEQPFALLTGGRRTARPRQKSLRASLDWSYERLSHSERLYLQRLATFHARFDLPAAIAAGESIGMDRTTSIECIASLVSRSMVVAHTVFGAQYSLLHTTRAYAWERVAESNAASDGMSIQRPLTAGRRDGAAIRIERNAPDVNVVWTASPKPHAHSIDSTRTVRRVAA